MNPTPANPPNRGTPQVHEKGDRSEILVSYDSVRGTRGQLKPPIHLPMTPETKNAPNPASRRKNADLDCFQLRAT